MDLGLRNKVVAVAASSSGLGFEIAKQASSEGALVALGSTNIKKLDDAVAKIRAVSSSKVYGMKLDVTDRDSIKAWIAGVLEEYGTIDSLVVNAGGPKKGTFEDFTDEDWTDAFNLTLMSSIRLIREVLPIMKRKQSGSILVLTSSAIKEPIAHLFLSNVLRAGVANLVKSLSFEIAPLGIRINNLVPGRIETDRVKQIDRALSEEKKVPLDEIKKKSISTIPMGRYGDPKEFGRVAVFLLSGAASYVTGATFLVDGGKMKGI
jgi:3-oxoacyl-[acyl-carrier protein] reductase